MKFTFICEDLDCGDAYSNNFKITHEFEHEDLDGIIDRFRQFVQDLSFVNTKKPMFSADDFLNGPKSLNDITDNAN